MPNRRASTVSMAFLAAVLSFASVASADDALRIAERGGFLLGQAYRCGSAVEHLENPANLIQSLLSAAAASPDEKTTAEQAFAEQFLVNMITPGHAGLLPSCARVRRELSRLTEHPARPPVPEDRLMSTQRPLRLVSPKMAAARKPRGRSSAVQAVEIIEFTAGR